MSDESTPQEPPAEPEPIPGVVDLTAKPVTVEALKTTPDNWDDVVAFTTVTVIDDAEDGVKTCYVRRTVYTADVADQESEVISMYEIYDGQRLQWSQFVISDWIVKVRDGVYEAKDELALGEIYELPAVEEPAT